MSRHGAKPKIRCAVYTRKSSEEGLEQSFNSLDAQREACAAYIDSQRHEGWLALDDRYDDGGYSGGTLERPALQRLIQDIDAGRVDTVVCYKIDRLSRSLTDFAKLVDVFERNSVTFVSVTQSFCTTTSMGRLTLNILLSFAQFERELAGERIRDKFAASRAKGMWMGGSRADRRRARRHLPHAACRRDSQPRRGAGGSGRSRSGHLRTLAGGCRVMIVRARFEVDTLTIRIPMRLQRRGGRKLIMMPEGAAAPARKPSRDETLVKALIRAHRWRRRIESGKAKSITDLAEQEGVTDAYVCRLLPLTCLAPDIVEAILDGRQPKGLRLAEMLGNVAVDWHGQRAVVERGISQEGAR